MRENGLFKIFCPTCSLHLQERKLSCSIAWVVSVSCLSCRTAHCSLLTCAWVRQRWSSNWVQSNSPKYHIALRKWVHHAAGILVVLGSLAYSWNNALHTQVYLVFLRFALLHLISYFTGLRWSVGRAAPLDPGGHPSLASPRAFGSGIPWLVAASVQSLPLWSHCLLLFHLPYLPLPFSHKDTSQGFKASLRYPTMSHFKILN